MVVKKAGWVVALSVVVTLAATGCGSDKKPGEASAAPKQEPTSAATAAATPETKKDPVTLKFMQYTASGSQEQTLSDMVKAFETANPDVKVKVDIVDYNNYYTKLNTQLASGDAPDVFEVGYENFVSYAAKNTLKDLTPIIAKDTTFKPEIYKGLAYDSFKYQNKQYGVVESFSDVVLFYNKDLFDKKQVEYPKADWTWKQELEAAQKLTDAKSGVWGTYSPIQFYEFYKTIAQNGGGIWSADGKPTVNSKENIEALNWMLDKAKKYKVSPALNDDTFNQPDADLNAFKAGKIAMLRGGIWNFSRFADAPFKWDIALEPGNTKKAHHFFADGLVVSDKTKNADAAWKFIKFMSSDPAVVSKRIEKGWSVPAVSDEKVMEAYFKQTPPESKKVVLEALNSLVLTPVGPIPDKWNDLTKAIGDELDKAKLKSDYTAEKALNEAQAKIEKLVAK
ncbi:sugar ABC transporter substrate-binding protein [Paenibacillus sp. HWE-109]|uniref:ABC transporter substrate-binding protein n=1 Tax=Paenibacillus sp. HWE-109 TaxID=1306526 RepID=UPI001EDE132E|nr:sugar ABC transporter substrate-binding protein [Paenibacillus sp. HWE-109]UKS30349.1 sugar ABC transporter substrate-binding protein [Paenibacillus sp. HWE-109]